MDTKITKVSAPLVLEITQRCNMSCRHCLRGPSRKVDITTDIIDVTLENYHAITSLTITGGEPSLRPDLVLYIARKIKELGIPLNSFYIVTNATIYSFEFVQAILELYSLSEEKEMCGLSVSIDQFHTEAKQEILDIYKAFTFYDSGKEHIDGINPNYLISRGNAKTMGMGRYREIEDLNSEYIDDWDDYYYISDNTVYVNAKGYIYFDCDLSYRSQDAMKKYNVSKITLADICRKYLLAKEEKESA